MGVRAKRWQLWLITMFILTGIIGVFQLFEGPKSIGAVTVAGGAVNPPIALPERSTTHDRCRDAARRGDDSSSRYPDRRADADRSGHAPTARHDPGSHHQGAGNLGQVGVNHARGDDDPAEGDRHCDPDSAHEQLADVHAHVVLVAPLPVRH